MALKSKISKTDHAALSAELQEHYKVNPLNAEEFLIDTDEADELRNANKRNKEKADELQKELDKKNANDAAAAKKLQDAADELAKKNGDITALEASWDKKLKDAVAEQVAKITKLTTSLHNLLVKSEASKIANEISTVPELIEPLIIARLSAELTGDMPVTRVLDANGQPSASNLDDLKKEFVANPKFATIIKANNASGGGAGDQKPGGGASKPFNTLTDAERTEWYNRDPNGFAAASDAAKKEKK